MELPPDVAGPVNKSRLIANTEQAQLWIGLGMVSRPCPNRPGRETLAEPGAGMLPYCESPPSRSFALNPKRQQHPQHFSLAFSMIVLSLVASANPAYGQGGAAKQAALQIVELPDGAAVRAAGRTLLEYRSAPSPLKPYVRELYTPGGVQILRDSPFDHKHHHGLMFALGVNGVDFWGEAAGAGSQKPRGRLETAETSLLDAPGARLAATLDWTDAHGKPLLVERREVAVAMPQGPVPVTLVLWRSELTPAANLAAVKLDGHHYYGLGMRFLTSMDKGGRFFNASKQPGDLVRGSERLVAARWSAYAAKADGKPVTVAIFDHKSNPRHPNRMFTMSPPFAYLSATLNLWKEPLELKTGTKLGLSYAVAVWDGEAPAEQIDALYEKWSKAKQ